MILKLCKLIYEEHTIGRMPKRKGQRVVLVHDAPHMPDESNPKQGSSYHCEGTVFKVRAYHSNRVAVRWDNGYANDYHPEELVVIPNVPNSGWLSNSLDGRNPNITFRERRQKLKMEEQARKTMEEHGGSYHSTATFRLTATGRTSWS